MNLFRGWRRHQHRYAHGPDKGTHLFSRHFCENSSATLRKMTTLNRTKSSSAAICLEVMVVRSACQLIGETLREHATLAHLADRGTTIDDSRSYFVSKSLTRFLHVQPNLTVNAVLHQHEVERATTHLGTATRSVSRYSESFVSAKSSGLTMSPNARVDRLPLCREGFSSGASQATKGTHVFLRSALLSWPLTTLYCWLLLR